MTNVQNHRAHDEAVPGAPVGGILRGTAADGRDAVRGDRNAVPGDREAVPDPDISGPGSAPGTGAVAPDGPGAVVRTLAVVRRIPGWLRLAWTAVLPVLRPVGRWLDRRRLSVRRRWRTSLQFRTVLVTLLIAFIALVGVGAYLSSQIANGLFQERLQQAKQESSRGITQVQESFDNAQLSDVPAASTYVRDTLKLLEVGGADDTRKYLMVLVPGQSNSLFVATVSSGGITPAIIPDGLRKAVQENSGQYWQSMSLSAGSSEEHPAVAIGSNVNLLGTNYELYLIYDLNNAQSTLNYIQSVLWLGGGILLLLIGGIALYVTRNVVLPISQAAAVSEKLAAGELQERMVVKGEDEVARLATSFNRMANSLQEQITQLAMLSHMQQRFVSDVSHELRTPLTTVRMAAEVLFDARAAFDPVNKRSAELLYHQVERFQALLSDLLEISRFDAGAAVLDAEPGDIYAVIHNVLEGAQPLAEQCGSTLTVIDSTEEYGSVVDMDPRRIDRILRNLVVNALEHGDGLAVELYLASDADTIAVAVRDHGIGMSASDVARVFDRFWRADPARARTTGGSGLGLSIATEDTRLHGGWLEAWGKPAAGSCFRLTLPRRSGVVLDRSPVGLPPGDDDDATGNLHLTGPAVTAAQSESTVTGAISVQGKAVL
ncbi:MtrAB system histidine kinase MtrB [Paenarthrobacter sp. PH39-S1]|uniref:MtrAB system histidine kinase MtrB n=1 Tax=Paenarthrobacter sp. PH39-S1 TaxID=3046204 RepID=UPI0024B92AC1|nr:MtrAB system histidine kinase MtrB [Paenarthrobacter sp. PH39-S1]MDJ0356451.1 MtrAB system histidine kinase MtrB [Paenarthrobacter sp. PH39-S1]